MPQALIVIFLLFFAVLAFAWFYLQRAEGPDPCRRVDRRRVGRPPAAWQPGWYRSRPMLLMSTYDPAPGTTTTEPTLTNDATTTKTITLATTTDCRSRVA